MAVLIALVFLSRVNDPGRNQTAPVTVTAPPLIEDQIVEEINLTQDELIVIEDIPEPAPNTNPGT
ncbi:MAG: hypothetical protein GTO60_04375, partial [Gammaproteobacteria bacterium]|nr:hypothetical protein [Gammaproteobacteria bacterium]